MFKNHAEREAEKLVLDSSRFYFLKKLYMKKKQVVCSVVWKYFDSPHTIKANCIKLYTIYWYMLNFDFSQKGLKSIPSPYFMYDFSRKILYSIKFNTLLTRSWRHQFKNNLVFWIKPLFDMIKNSRQKFKYLENDKNF